MLNPGDPESILSSPRAAILKTRSGSVGSPVTGHAFALSPICDNDAHTKKRIVTPAFPRDTTWLKRPATYAGAYRPWLTDPGSLTSRIKARCPAFSLELDFQGRRRVNRDERFIMGRTRDALVREVWLLCRRKPVVFAHSILDPRDVRSAWQQLPGLGTRPLGAALFADPRIKRYPLRTRRLGPHHELYARAVSALTRRPAALWARRSLFELEGSPILVTEVFLPGILAL